MSDGRRYPSKPVLGVGAVAIAPDGRVVLIRRGQPPLSGRWSLPGGVLEVGESLADGLIREVREETGLDVDIGPLAAIYEHITRDLQGMAEYHFVILDYVCHVRGGELRASSDASAVVLADPGDLDRYDLTAKALDAVRRGLMLAGSDAS